MILYRFYTVQGSIIPKNEYFPRDILFTTIHLLQEHEVNPRIYSK
jgi:hypothetical protein